MRCPVPGCDWHRRAKVEPVHPADFGPGMVRDPRTDEEWQDAADMANLCLALDAAWQYGLVEPDPKVNVARCEYVLEQARRRGIEPTSLEGGHEGENG